MLVNPPGKLVNEIYAEYLTNSNLTTTIPTDDTIPQSSEGTEIMTITITPQNAGNVIRIRFFTYGSANIHGAWSGAIFKDSGANAIAAGLTVSSVNDYPNNLYFEYEESAGSTTARTYKIRVGPVANILRLNGLSGSRVFGGIGRATFVVEEYSA